MASRSGVHPPPRGQGAVRCIQSPRQQVALRVSSTEAASRRQTIANSQNYSNVTTMTKAGIASDLNPKVAEIRSRVDELVRRYDDAVAAVDREEFLENKDREKTIRPPARWRVGDVLMAAHRALAHTSTHTQRTMVSDFADDPEVSAAIGSGAQKVGKAFTEALAHAAQRHKRLLQIHGAMQSVAANGMPLDDSANDSEDEKLTSRDSQLQSTIDALHREKNFMAAQVQEALRGQQESRMAMEQQELELSKAHRSLQSQAEELRFAHEQNKQAVDAANLRAVSWRDKFQTCARTANEAEVKVQELEDEVRAMNEEIMKHKSLLEATAQEVEYYREKEAAREAEARREEEGRKLSVDGSNKDVQELEDRVRELEDTLCVMKDAKRGLENENMELSRRLRDVQARLEEQHKIGLSVNTGQLKPVSRFVLRLRETRASCKRRRGKIVTKMIPKPTSVEVVAPKSDDDDFSSSESEADDNGNDEEVGQVERDEREINQAVQVVVATVCPTLSSMESETNVDDIIAQYEDPVQSPLRLIQPNVVSAASVVSDEQMVPQLEVDTLRKMYENEIDALKLRYVAGLQDYKRLVTEQYDRRQAVESERRRLQIEELLRLIQTKFHAELARRSERVNRAKASLRMLYNTLRQHSGPAVAANDGKKLETEAYSSVTPLKTLLRAAVLVVISTKRNGQSKTHTEAIHKHLTRLPFPCDARTKAVAAAMTIHTIIQDDESLKSHEKSCQTSELPIQLHLEVGTSLSDALMAELRQCVPNLSPEMHRVSNALRLALFRELVKFCETYQEQRVVVTATSTRDARVVIGSPRHTPYLRRKAFEAMTRRNRSHLFTSGGVAILQSTFTST